MHQSSLQNSRIQFMPQNSINSNPTLRTHENSNIIYSNKKLEHINCIENATSEMGALFLGDIICILKPQIIQNNNIAAVLSCLVQTNYSLNTSNYIYHKVLPAKDSLDYPIHIHFNQAYDFIQAMRKQKKNVLVHCHAGISRSAAIACSYLMRKNNWTSSEALNYLRNKRNRIKPNQNFIRILQQFEAKNNQKSTIDLQISRINRSVTITNGLSQNYANYKKKVNMSGYRNSMQVSQHIGAGEQMFDSRKSNNNQTRKRFSNIGLYASNKSRFSQSLQHSKKTKNIETNANTKQRIKDKQNVQKKEKFEQSDKLSFGQQFKNKISSLLGRNTRIPWELSENRNKNDWASSIVSIGCI